MQDNSSSPAAPRTGACLQDLLPLHSDQSSRSGVFTFFTGRAGLTDWYESTQYSPFYKTGIQLRRLTDW
jgi:hypothetical protein